MIAGIINSEREIIKPMARNINHFRTFAREIVPVEVIEVIIDICAQSTLVEILATYERYVNNSLLECLQNKSNYISLYDDVGDVQKIAAIMDHEIINTILYQIFYSYNSYVITDRENTIFIDSDELPKIIELIASWRPRICTNSENITLHPW